MNPLQTNPLESQLDHHKVAIDAIFTRENLPAILAVVNSLLPKDRERIAQDEFWTIVNAARYDGALKLTNDIVTFTANRTTPHVG